MGVTVIDVSTWCKTTLTWKTVSGHDNGGCIVVIVGWMDPIAALKLGHPDLQPDEPSSRSRPQTSKDWRQETKGQRLV